MGSNGQRRPMKADSGRRFIAEPEHPSPGLSGYESSTHPFLTTQKYFDLHGLDIREFLEGMQYPSDYLLTPDKRVSWDCIIELCERVEARFTDDEVIAIGRDGALIEPTKYLIQIAKLFHTVKDVYIFTRRAETGAVHNHFWSLRTSVVVLGPNVLQLEMGARAGYRWHRVFGLVEAGMLTMLPSLLGAPHAEVTWQPIDNGFRYQVRYQRVPGAIGFLRERLADFLPKNQSVGDEVRTAYLKLKQQYAELASELEHRRRAEGERDRMAAALAAAQEGVFITNSEGVIEWVNEYFSRHSGYAPEEVIGQTPRILKSGKTPPSVYEEMWGHLKAGQPWRGEITNRKKDGTLYDVELTISPMNDDSGRLAWFVTVERDVTERNRMNRLLQGVFPKQVVREVQKTGRIQPREHARVAVLFVDVVGFTEYCASVSPTRTLTHLQRLIQIEEAAAQLTGLLKIKTVGDAFMATAGMMDEHEEPVRACVNAGLVMIEASQHLSAGWSLRAGVHVGPVISGAVGKRQMFFDIWGDTVNTAARVQSHALPSTVCVTQEAMCEIEGVFEGVARRTLHAKGKGKLDLYDIPPQASTRARGQTCDLPEQPAAD